MSGRSLELSVFGLPTEGEPDFNRNYLTVIDDLDALVVPKSLILSGSGADEVGAARQALPEAFRVADGRPIFFRNNQRWRIALGTRVDVGGGDGGSLPSPEVHEATIESPQSEPADAGLAPTIEDIILLYGTQVDQTMLLALLAAWGSADPEWDLNGDGIVNMQGLLLLLSQFPSDGG